MIELLYILLTILFILILILLYSLGRYKKNLLLLTKKLEEFQLIIDNLPSPAFIKENSKVIYSNKAFDIAFGINKSSAYKALSKLNLNPTQTITLKFDNDIEKPVTIFSASISVNEKRKNIHILFDTSSFKKENQKLVNWKQRYDLALKGSQSGLWDWNINEDRIYFSNKWKEIMGYFSSDKPDSLNSWLDLVDARDLALVNEALSKHLNHETGYFEITHRVKLIQPTRWVNVRGKAVFENGTATRMLGIITDITKSKETENELNKSKKLFATFMDNLPAVAFIKDSKNRYIYLNNFYERYIGFKEWKNKTPKDIFDEDVANRIIENDRKAFYEGIKKHEEIIPNEEGTLKYFESYKFPIDNDDNEKLLCGFGIDKTKEKRYQEKIKLYAQIFNNTQEAIVITDKNGSIIDVNKAFEDITGYLREEILGKNPNILKSDINGDKFFENMWSSLQKHGKFSGEIFNINKDGKIMPQLTSISSIKDKNGNVVNYFAIYQSIAEQKKTEAKLRRLANYDNLTKLPNRFLFEDRLKSALGRVDRLDIKIALVFIDLDNFKEVNDTLGHDAGDRVLQEVAKKLTSAIRESDTVSRLGGDEFVTILEDIKDETNLYNICSKMLQNLNKPFKLIDNQYHINASIGVAIAPDNTKDYDELLKFADIAMYKAKNEGKNRIVIYKEL